MALWFSVCNKRRSERLLFGSDWPFGSPVRQIRELRNLGLPEPTLRKVCAENLLRLYDAVRT